MDGTGNWIGRKSVPCGDIFLILAEAPARMRSSTEPVRLLDSTLREGEQHPGVSFTEKQRAQLAWELDSFGVDQIEISPVISPVHRSSTRTILGLGLGADIVCHGRALAADVDIHADLGAEWCAAYIGISEIHMRDKLRITREQAERRAVDAVERAKSYGMKIRLTLEDGSRADPAFAIRMARAVYEAGVDRISLPDTTGAMLPEQMADFVRMIRREVGCGLDVHCHNDMGLALANSLAGIGAGADQLHVTINGIGERTGIPSLAEAAVVVSRPPFMPSRRLRLDTLCDMSRHLELYTGMMTPESMPIVGSSAYKHKAGTHLSAIMRNPEAYEVLPPGAVGNRRKVVFGGLTGAAGAARLLDMLGVDSSADASRAAADGLKSLGRDIIEIDMPTSDAYAKTAATPASSETEDITA